MTFLPDPEPEGKFGELYLYIDSRQALRQSLLTNNVRDIHERWPRLFCLFERQPFTMLAIMVWRCAWRHRNQQIAEFPCSDAF